MTNWTRSGAQKLLQVPSVLVPHSFVEFSTRILPPTVTWEGQDLLNAFLAYCPRPVLASIEQAGRLSFDIGCRDAAWAALHWIWHALRAGDDSRKCGAAGDR